MNLEILTQIFQWSTILGVVIYAFSVFMTIIARDFMYGFHKRWFELSRETFSVAIYSYLGIFKVLLILFLLVPYLALLVVGSGGAN